MSLTKNEKRVLDYVREGRNTLADFTDNLGITAPQANDMAEKLELAGYLVKEDYVGIKRFNFLLTEKGAKELTVLSEEDQVLLSEAGINRNQLKILQHSATGDKVMAADIAQKIDVPPMEIISDFRYLVDKGLLFESGILRRKVSITPQGSVLLKKYN